MNLADKSCRSIENGEPPLNKERIVMMLSELNDWDLINNSIQKSFRFQNFADSLAFVNNVGAIAESEDHHPDIAISWNQVTLSLTTHAVNGLSENDFILAAKIDQINN